VRRGGAIGPERGGKKRRRGGSPFLFLWTAEKEMQRKRKKDGHVHCKYLVGGEGRRRSDNRGHLQKCEAKRKKGRVDGACLHPVFFRGKKKKKNHAGEKFLIPEIRFWLLPSKKHPAGGTKRKKGGTRRHRRRITRLLLQRRKGKKRRWLVVLH